MESFFNLRSQTKNKATILNFDEIKVGSSYSFKRTITSQDVLQFSSLSGDVNPLHVDDEFAKKSPFRKKVVHGLLTASLFSTLIGMYCPGQNSLYLSQTLRFKKPLFYDETVNVSGIVMAKVDSLKIVTIKTEITREADLIVSGEAQVKIII